MAVNRIRGAFAVPRKGETFELRAGLVSQYAYERKESIQKTIMAMTLGKDVSALFPDVLKNIATADLDQKKLVYLYLMHVFAAQNTTWARDTMLMPAAQELCQITPRSLHSCCQYLRTRLGRPEPFDTSASYPNHGLHPRRQNGGLHGGASAKDLAGRVAICPEDGCHMRRQAVRSEPHHVHRERILRDAARADWRSEPHGRGQLGTSPFRNQRDRARDKGTRRHPSHP